MIQKYVKSMNFISRHLTRNVINYQFSEDSSLSTIDLAMKLRQSPANGSLSIRNSETYEFKIDFLDPQLSAEIVTLDKSNKLGDLIKQIQDKYNLQKCKFFNEHKNQISQQTPIEALMNQLCFFMGYNDLPAIIVEGQFLHPVEIVEKSPQIIQNLSNLELPLLIERDIEKYLKRISIHLDAKYGAHIVSKRLLMPIKDVKYTLVQSLLDPQQLQSTAYLTSVEWKKLYWQVQQLRDKKEKAGEVCRKMVRNRMALGLPLIAANIGMIWAGTYIFYSWDIMEPIAYFVSSFAGIILALQALKIGKPYSNLNYRKYLFDKYIQTAYERVGLKIQTLQEKQNQLRELQSEMKDYFIRKL